MTDNVVSISPNVVRIDKSRDPIRTLEALCWAFLSKTKRQPRYLIVGPAHLAMLVRAARSRGVQATESGMVEFMGLQVVKVARDTLELGS